MIVWANRPGMHAHVVSRAALVLTVLTVLLGLAPGTAQANSATQAQKAEAKKALLVISDFPKGWRAGKTASSLGGSIGGGGSGIPAAMLASCIGVPAALRCLNAPGLDGPDV